MKDNEMIEVLEFYFNRKITIHIDTFSDAFYNGLILEFSKTMIVIDDRILGEVPISISDIKVLERFKEGEKHV